MPRSYLINVENEKNTNIADTTDGVLRSFESHYLPIGLL